MAKKELRWAAAGMLIAIGLLLLLQQLPFISGFALPIVIIAAIVALIMSFVR
jgi:ABC-type Fe3+ transport system permease subunit